MRVLYLHPNSWTGEYPMLLKLRGLGHEVCVLEETRELGRGKRRVDGHFRHPGDGIATLWYDPRRGWERLVTWPLDRVFRRSFDGRNLIHRMWVIGEAVRRFRPDAIVCSDGFSYAIPASFLKQLGWLRARLLVSYIGGDILDCPEAEVGKRRTRMVTWLIRKSVRGPETLRPVSPMLEAILLAEGAPRERIRVCPSHLVRTDREIAPVLAERSGVAREVRDGRRIPQDAQVAITLGGNHKGKGMHVLARAWPAVVRSYPNARWLLCGPAHAWLEEAVWPVLREAGIAHTVAACGALDAAEVFRHLAAADVHVNPSLCESLNMVTVEAAAVGTPTITSDGAGIAHWVSRFQAGAVVPRGDVEALADAIISALRDRDGLRRWSSAGVAMASEFSLERVAAALLVLMSGDQPA
jgi:glycosyltransferase involved in cell wall biosynthesis